MNKIINKIIKLFFKKISKNKKTNFLGSNYGGWHFLSPVKNLSLNVISAGVGEDISFDVEFINSYNSKVVLIDPTPRAILHVENVLNNLGRKKTKNYKKNSGNQLIESYELSKIKKKNIVLFKKALFNKSNQTVKFYLPKNKNHVSHSISNFQNNFSKDTDFIEVETISIDEVMEQVGFKKIDLFKLDIEGAENYVIPDMLDKKIFPDQILVEFDELRTNKVKPFVYALKIFLRLIFNGYELVKTNNFPNFLFVKKVRYR
jgi:FkbM family methyltransferase